MSGAVLLVADTHFGHRLAAGLRGFDNTDDHDRELIKRWNAAVKPGDQVWHLGDVTLRSFAAVADVLSELNGTLHLITGNHDTVWPGHREAHKVQAQWLTRFASIQPFARRRIGGQEVLLSHFPYAGSGDHTDEERYRQFRLPDLGLPLLHGHVHAAWKRRGRMLNVGVDVWDLAPVMLQTAMEVLDG